jgi:molybdopterin-guanine dinucleotide biosynthesis protein A
MQERTGRSDAQAVDESFVTSVVLAGGKGKRFGRDKLSEIIGGRTLLCRVVDTLGGMTGETLIVIGQGQPGPSLPEGPARVTVDLYPEKSALGGIYTGLVVSRSLYSLVVAADMPFLNTALLRYMVSLAAGFDVVIPRVDGALEPLHAVYSKNCLDPMRRQIERGELKIRDALGLLKVRYVEKEEVERFDPDQMSFFNINTMADLNRARTLIERAGDAGI